VSASALVEGGSVDKGAVGLFESNDGHFLFREFPAIAMGVCRVEGDPRAFPGVPRLHPERVRPVPVAEDHAAADSLASEYGQKALGKLATTAIAILEEIIH
jgi:hypothetical protein